LRVAVYGGGALLLTNIAALVLLVLFSLVTGQTDMLTKIAETGKEPEISGHIMLAMTAGAAPIAWLWTFLFRRRIDMRSVRSLGLRGAGAGLSFVKGWIGGALAPGAILGAGLLLGVYGIGDSDGSSIGFVRVGALPLLLLLIGFAFQGSTEELVLRGYIQRNMVDWKAGRRAWFWILILPSLLFGLGHFMNPGFGFVPFVNTVLIGIFFGALVLTCGQLWTVFGIHTGWNAALAVIWSLPVSGLETAKLLPVEVQQTGTVATHLFGGSYGPEGGLVTTVLILAAIGIAVPRAISAFRDDAWGTSPPS
jgi:membrane protease YdiL (CAAX protease family)